MAEVQQSWREVVAKTEALGQKLKLHLDREEAESSDAEPGPTPPLPASEVVGNGAGDDSDSDSDGGDGKREATRAALEDLGHRVQDVFESFGAAAKDPSVRTDMKEIGVALKDALLATLTTVSSEVSDVVKKASGQGKDDADEGAATAAALAEPSSSTPQDTVAPDAGTDGPASSGDADDS
jgi:hypothetical protein